MKKILKNKIKPKTQSSNKTGVAKKPKYSFGTIEEFSYDELLGAERGEMLQAFGQTCYCGMYSSDPYNCNSGLCDNRC
ncbi:MAG: hypothetical protein K2Q18_09910 [Bdellovibrionales bacterium]|nr:hypothetical protein [Bdellovibrionales bacterium]